MRDDDLRLQDMLEASEKAVRHAAGRERSALDRDEILALALTRLLEIVGEAARNVPQGFRDAHPEIPWSAIAGTRDKLIHGYFDVDLDIVWQIVTVDLPALIAALKRIVGSPP